MVPIRNYTEPNAKKIIKIGSQLAKKSGNIETKKKFEKGKTKRMKNRVRKTDRPKEREYHKNNPWNIPFAE